MRSGCNSRCVKSFRTVRARDDERVQTIEAIKDVEDIFKFIMTSTNGRFLLIYVNKAVSITWTGISNDLFVLEIHVQNDVPLLTCTCTRISPSCDQFCSRCFSMNVNTCFLWFLVLLKEMQWPLIQRRHKWQQPW